MLALAGCQIVPAIEPQAQQPLPVPQSSAPQLPTEPLPEPQGQLPGPQPRSTPPPEAERHAVAVLVPLTGPNAGVGRSIANAANLALADTGGETVRITVYDTGPGAAVAANQAIAAGNRLILGPLLAEESRAIAPAARRAGVPVVSFSNDVSAAGGGVHIMGFNPAQSIERVVAYARSRGLQRFGALIPAGTYGQRASQAMIAAVERGGGRMVAMQTYDRRPAGLRNAVSRLGTQGQYDAVLIADSPRTAAQAVPLIRRGSANVRILGTELWSAEGRLGETAALRGAWFAAAPETRFEQFRGRYRARYGAMPYRLSSLGYDAVLLAIRIGRDLPVGRSFPALALRDREPFIGLDGAFQFDRAGVARRGLEVHEVMASGTTTVSPAPRTSN
jgi:ABC-type branched-subunit amino acid transport system substrate-binding protein